MPVERDRWIGLPAWLRPRAVERGSGAGGMGGSDTGRRWLIETTLLVLVGLLLAIATVNDVARQAGINHRLEVDMRTWRHYTGHDYRDLSVDRELYGQSSQREVVCGNTGPGAPETTTQICLVVWGPVVNGRRTVHGGWYLPAGVEVEDIRLERYGCFGGAARGRCPR